MNIDWLHVAQLGGLVVLGVATYLARTGHARVAKVLDAVGTGLELASTGGVEHLADEMVAKQAALAGVAGRPELSRVVEALGSVLGGPPPVYDAIPAISAKPHGDSCPTPAP